MRAAQAGRLTGFDVSWHDQFGAVPPGPILLVANEFFDALPTHQLVATARGWVERSVDLDTAGRLTFRLDQRPFSPRRPPARGDPRHARGGQPGAQRAGTRHRPPHRG